MLREQNLESLRFLKLEGMLSAYDEIFTSVGKTHDSPEKVMHSLLVKDFFQPPQKQPHSHLWPMARLRRGLRPRYTRQVLKQQSRDSV